MRPLRQWQGRTLLQMAQLAQCLLHPAKDDIDGNRQRGNVHAFRCLPGLVMPSWQEVIDREYEQWDRARLVIDTAGIPLEEALAALKSAVSNHVTL